MLRKIPLSSARSESVRHRKRRRRTAYRFCRKTACRYGRAIRRTVRRNKLPRRRSDRKRGISRSYVLKSPVQWRRFYVYLPLYRAYATYVFAKAYPPLRAFRKEISRRVISHSATDNIQLKKRSVSSTRNSPFFSLPHRLMCYIDAITAKKKFLCAFSAVFDFHHNTIGGNQGNHRSDQRSQRFF